MKKILNLIGRIMGAFILCALSAISLIGMLCYYQTLTALPFAAIMCVSFIGAVAMISHEESKKAPLADTKTAKVADEQTYAA